MENQNNVNIENLQLASSRSRIRAFIIDDFAITFVIMLLLWDKISMTNGDFMSILLLINGAVIQVMILKFIYQTFFVWYYGATLGKLVAKIKVIDFNSFGRVSFTNAMLRSMGRIISEMFFYLGFVLAFYTDSRQTFHDKIGKTLVVNS